MKLNTNNNAYIIIYSAILVIIVAFLLAFVFKALKPMQDRNVERTENLFLHVECHVGLLLLLQR